LRFECKPLSLKWLYSEKDYIYCINDCLILFGLVLSLLIVVSLSLSAVMRRYTSFSTNSLNSCIVGQAPVPKINWNKRTFLHKNVKGFQWFMICFLRPEKSTLKLFFAFIALQFWEMALLFYFYLGKFGFNIFPDLKSKQIKYLKNYKKKLNLPTFLIKFVYTFYLSLISLFVQICLLV
jgi:hypothetical protein